MTAVLRTPPRSKEMSSVSPSKDIRNLQRPQPSKDTPCLPGGLNRLAMALECLGPKHSSTTLPTPACFSQDRQASKKGTVTKKYSLLVPPTRTACQAGAGVCTHAEGDGWPTYTPPSLSLDVQGANTV